MNRWHKRPPLINRKPLTESPALGDIVREDRLYVAALQRAGLCGKPLGIIVPISYCRRQRHHTGGCSLS